MFNLRNDRNIMVIGYNTQQDESGIVIDIVKTIEEAENKDDQYHANYTYTDFTVVEDGQYKIGDNFKF